MIRVFSQYVSPRSILLVLLEGFVITVALVCAARLWFWDSNAGFLAYVGMSDFLFQLVVFVVILQVSFYYCHLYDLTAIRHHHEMWISLGQSLGVGCLLLGLLYFAFPHLVISRGVFFMSIALVAAFVTVNRFILERLWKIAAPRESTIILGTGKLGLTVGRELTSRDDLDVLLKGFVSLNTEYQTDGIVGRPVLGVADQLPAIVEEHGISRIIVALEDRRQALPIRELVKLRVSGVRVEEAHSTISSLTGRVWLETVKPSWFVFSDGFHRSAITAFLKRTIDLVCSLLGLVLSAPLMLLVAVVIRLDSKGPVIYRQARVGLRGRVFHVLKFRSMRIDAEAQNGAQWASTHDPRVTRIGRFLRTYRLDELPQFVNVIRGEMSFVGPRPERPVFVEQLRKEISYYDERHTVRPGLTGWAQVQYQYGASVEDAARKLEYDLFYLKNMSVLFDCAIIFKTVGIVLTGHGGR
jgi:sugar transferase (PEP-CTERM system associated)